MAEITDTLRLDIDQALADVNRLERALDVAIAPIEVEVDTREADQLAETLREVQRIADRAATETQSIALAAGTAEANFEDVARALNISEDEARRMTAELLQAQAASNRVEDAARDIARQLGLSDQEADRLTRSLREADRAAEAIDVTTLSVGQRFAALRTSAAAIAAVLAGVGGTAILVGALSGANAAIQSFARLEDSINAVRVTFGNASAEVLNFGETAAASAGLSEEAFNQAVVPIGSLLQNFGFDAQEAAAGAVVLVQRAADLASVMGGTVQDALLAVGAALRGEADPLERYGASISAARVEQFALAEGLARTKAELTPSILLQARYGLILSDTARVSGDFANTADDLANAQRSAGAAVQNFVADIGEDLAPALETILVLLPEVIEGLRQLVPGFAAAAGSAASFFESVGEGGGFRTEFAAIRAGFDVVTGGAGLAVEASSVFAAGLRGDFRGVADAAQRGGALIERAFTRGIGVTLANSLDKGTDAVEAFTTALEQTASLSSNIDIFTENYTAFAIAAGLSDLQLRDATVAMIENAAAAGLTAEEIAFLTTQVALLNSFLFQDIEAVRQFNAEVRALGEDSLNTTTTRFTTFTSELEEIPDRMSSVALEINAAADKVGEALNPFDDATEKIDVSAREFFENLVTQINEQATFQAGIAQLIIREQFNLAESIAAQGPGAQQALDGFLNNINLAERAEALLAGEGTEVSNLIGDELIAALSSADLPPQVEQAFIGLIEDGVFSNSQVEAAIVQGTLAAASDTVSSYREGLEAEIANINSASLAEAVEAALGASFNFADLTYDLGVDTAKGYEQGIRDGLEIQSPSKVLARLGADAAAGFLEGWEQSDLTLRLPTVPTGGLDTTAMTGTAAGGGVNIQLITNNPIQMDEVSDTARMGQIASSIAASYRSVVPNGM